MSKKGYRDTPLLEGYPLPGQPEYNRKSKTSPGRVLPARCPNLSPDSKCPDPLASRRLATPQGIEVFGMVACDLPGVVFLCMGSQVNCEKDYSVGD